MKDKEYISIPFITGTDGNATVTFIDVTFQKVNDTFNRYPDPEFGAWLIEQIFAKKKILAEKWGFFEKKLFCSSCRTELNPELQTPKRIDCELKYKDFDPFIAYITIPSVICPQCNRICGIDLDGSLSDHINEAIIAAFKSKNINP